MVVSGNGHFFLLLLLRYLHLQYLLKVQVEGSVINVHDYKDSD